MSPFFILGLEPQCETRLHASSLVPRPLRMPVDLGVCTPYDVFPFCIPIFFGVRSRSLCASNLFPPVQPTSRFVSSFVKRFKNEVEQTSTCSFSFLLKRVLGPSWLPSSEQESLPLLVFFLSLFQFISPEDLLSSLIFFFPPCF